MVTEEHASPSSVTPDLIMQLAMGFMASKHLFVANEIGIFGQLAGGPATLAELAHRTGVPHRTVRISADAMVALGLVERNGDHYQNGAVAAMYLSGLGPADLRPLLRFWNRISYPTWMGLEEAIRSGQALAAAYDFSIHHRVLDLGGGTGSFLIPVLRRHAGLEGTLFELPGAVAVARQRLDREPEGARIEVVAGDFFKEAIPAGHDAIIVANVIHLFFPEQNYELLRRSRQSVTEGARLLIVDLLTDPTHTQPAAAALSAGEFLVIAGHGDVYSEEELSHWLRETGWRPLERKPLAGPASLLVAEAI